MHDPLIVTESQPATLATRIDPNTASAAELSRIPHIGPKLAEAIVKYRDSRKSMAPGGIVFGRVEDLDRVTGIGKALVAQLRPFLDFPEPASEPDSQPASK